MKRFVSIIAAVLLPLALFAADSLKATMKTIPHRKDSLLIGDQIRYTLPLRGVDRASWIELPILGDRLSRVDVIGQWEKDTVAVKSDVMDVDASIMLAAFEEGEYLLPDLPVVVHNPGGVCDTLFYKGLDVLVCTIPLDSTFVLKDIRPQATLELTWKDKFAIFFENHPAVMWILIGLGILLFTGLLIWLVIYLVKRNAKAVQFKDPAHVVALRKLDGLRGDKLWAEPKQKQFYSSVTDTLKEYICERYGISAMEMTTAEMMASLKATDVPAELSDELRELFERADYVKFAKYVASEQENAQTVPCAVKFVVGTYQQEIKEEVKDVL